MLNHLLGVAINPQCWHDRIDFTPDDHAIWIQALEDRLEAALEGGAFRDYIGGKDGV